MTEISKGIAKMYDMMSETCKKTSKAIEDNLDDYQFVQRKMGVEFKTNNKTYQLILELKEVQE